MNKFASIDGVITGTAMDVELNRARQKFNQVIDEARAKWGEPDFIVGHQVGRTKAYFITRDTPKEVVHAYAVGERPKSPYEGFESVELPNISYFGL